MTTQGRFTTVVRRSLTGHLRPFTAAAESSGKRPSPQHAEAAVAMDTGRYQSRDLVD